MYVAVKGGEAAIDAAHELLARDRRGDPAVPELSLAQIESQLRLAVDRVMAEGGLYDRRLAALHGYIHLPSRRMLRGRPQRRLPQVKKMSTPRGKAA